MTALNNQHGQYILARNPNKWGLARCPRLFAMLYLSYFNTFIVFIVGIHLYTVLVHFDKVDRGKAVKIQTDDIETKSECVSTCSCDAPKYKKK